jgi:hypothetical protein
MSRSTNTRPGKLGLLAAAAAVSGSRFEVTGAGEFPRVVQPSFAEKVAEAIDVLVDAKIDYALSRRDVGAEWVNSDAVYRAQDRLTSLLGKISS